MKKKLTLLTCFVMALSMLFAGTALAEDYQVNAADLSTSGYQVNADLDQSAPVTLTIFGPGIFSIGEKGVTDLVSGIYKPGYSEIVDRWSELYPNVTLDIQPSAWDSWQSAITTACLSGEVDVIMHGATMTDLTLDLSDYLANDPQYKGEIYATASRRTTDRPDQYKVSGISVSLSPAVVWLDTTIFSDYGIELPTADWTYDDVLSLASQMTGTDPVTGEQTYGLQMFAAGANNLWFNFTQTANALGAKVYTYGPTLKDCTVNYLSDEGIAAFQLIADLSQYASPDSKEGVAVTETLDGTNSWAMLFREGPVSAYYEMEAAGLIGRYVPVTLPVCTAGEYAGIPTPHAGDNNMAIFKDSDQKEWAWEFIKFMTTDDVATQWVVNNLNYPNNKAGKSYVEEMVGAELTETMDKALGTLPEGYNNATNDAFNNVSFGSTTNAQITAVDNVINGYMTAEEAAKYMQDYVDEYLKTME